MRRIDGSGTAYPLHDVHVMCRRLPAVCRGAHIGVTYAARIPLCSCQCASGGTRPVPGPCPPPPPRCRGDMDNYCRVWDMAQPRVRPASELTPRIRVIPRVSGLDHLGFGHPTPLPIRADTPGRNAYLLIRYPRSGAFGATERASVRVSVPSASELACAPPPAARSPMS